MLGALLAALVVLLFLGNLRSTIIAALAIPTSIIGTFALMWVEGFTLNTITLLALALAVGIVIDDAIVVLENIFRFIDEKGDQARSRPRSSATQGDRPRRARDHAVAHRGVPPGRVHGRHPRALPEELRPHDGVRHRRLAARQLHADADARRRAGCRRHAGRRARRSPCSSASSTSFYRPIERVYMRALALRDAAPLGGRRWLRRDARLVRAARARRCPRASCPRTTRRSSRSTCARPKARASRRRSSSPSASRARSASCPRSQLDARHHRRRRRSARQPGAAST